MADKPKGNVSLVLPEAQCNYANLLRPRANDDTDADSEKSYSVMLVFDAETDVTPIKRAIIAAAKLKWGDAALEMLKTGRLHNPLRKGDELENTEFHGLVFMNARRKESLGPPGIVNGRVEPIIDPTEVYSGMYGHVSVSLYPYIHKGKKGVGVGLNNVQKTRDGERKGGKPDPKSEFKPLAGAGSSSAGSDDDFDI